MTAASLMPKNRGEGVRLWRAQKGPLLLLRSCLFAISISALVPSAWAACPADSVTRAAEVLIRSEQQGGDFAALAAEADALSAACRDDPYTNHVLTRAHATLALRMTTPEKAAAQAVLAWRAYRAMAKFDASGNRYPPRSFTTSAGTVTIEPYPDGELAEALIDLLAQTEALTGKPTEFSRPVRQGDPSATCEMADYSFATYYGYAIPWNGRPDWKIILAMLDRNIAACEGKVEASQLDVLLTQSAQIRVEALEKNWTPAPEDRIAMAATAKAHLQRAFEVRPEGGLLMKRADRNKMDEFLATVLPPVPEADWFLPENASSVYVMRTMAMLIDAAWAADRGQVTGMRASEEISRLDALARKQPDPKAARRLVWLAARGHGQGRFRRPENAALPPTPEFFWNWVNPDYKPPAQ